MFTQTKTEVDCSPGASTEVVKKEKNGPRVWGEEEADDQGQQDDQPDEKNNIKQPHIRLALSRADTLAAIKSAPGQRHLHARLVRQGR